MNKNSLDDREITVSEIPSFYRQMTSAQRSDYTKQIHRVQASASKLLTHVANTGTLCRLIQCTGQAIYDLEAFQGLRYKHESNQKPPATNR